MRKFRYLILPAMIAVILVSAGCDSTVLPEGDPENGPAIDPPDADPEDAPEPQDSDEPPSPDLTATFEALAPPLPPEGWWELKHHKVVLNCTGDDTDINSPVVNWDVDSETNDIQAVYVFDGTGYIHSEIDDNIPRKEMRLESFTDEVYSVVLYDDEAGESIDFYIQSPDAFPFGFGFAGAIEIPGAMRLDYYLQYSADEPDTINGLIISFMDNCVVQRPVTLEFLGSFD